MQPAAPSSEGTSLSQAAASLPKVPSPGKAQSGGGVQTKIDVQSLFSQAMNSTDSQSKQMPGNMNENSSGKSAKPVCQVVSNDEFAAMFKSLEKVHIAEEENRQKEEKEEVLFICAI